uniref:Liprin-beta-1-like n=1 Tax=Sinocyclocheilus anshuiensis TaxID=1608454 RepID=A0A671QYF1_9TELE
MMCDASEMLAAALEQMDGIIAGSKAMNYTNGLFDCQSPTSPFLGSLRVLHLLEDLRAALDLMDPEEKESLRSQVSETTAEGLMEWLQSRLTNGHGSAAGDLVYQERLSRLESDKECLVLQVSVLTDQVEVQGEKIRDLDSSLEEHRMKLNATEELLQQELLSRSALETEKLELLTEVSSLKLKLAAAEGDCRESEVRSTCLHHHHYIISGVVFVCSDMEVKRMRSAVESLKAANEEKVTNMMSCYFVVTITSTTCQHTHFHILWFLIKPSPKNGGSPSISPTQPSSGGNESFGSKKTRSSFGRGFFKIRGNKMTSTLKESVRGLSTWIWPECKLRSLFNRSQSTSDDLDDSPESAFSRGGVRATAGPRLGWSRDLQRSNNNELDSPFSRWSKEQVCEWLQNQGLDLYVNQAQQWISSGQTLLKASQHDLEKDMGIRHPLHRKKLQLALQSLGSEEDDAMGKLDYNWVTRWLDDIGLPQYKSQFDESRVDGRMLHYMTVDDLLGLKVGSVLHHLSMKRAIQVLRINCYDPSCLRRRPTENNPTPAEICQWTNHRVMEWLRSVDLAEYAPNLRGSGVHGGLMVLEPRFNVETMALLLNIPPNKTLLRRHLATNFHLLIGSEAQRLKQEYLENSDYTVLTATAKVKPRRLSFGSFGTLRRKRQEEMEEYVCPMDVQMPQSSSFNKGLCAYEDSLDQLEQMEDSEGTVRQIGAFSEGINNLTSMLKEDEFFMEASSHSPETSTIDDD